MTEQECLNKHRELWKNVSLKVCKEKKWIDKGDKIFPNCKNGCYCCYYVYENSDEYSYEYVNSYGCLKCPIFWGNKDNIPCLKSLYGNYVSLQYNSDYRKIAKIAYKISQLPPNYTLYSLESAIYWHRKMWNFIADTIKSEKYVPTKLDFMQKFKVSTHIKYHCFLCAYALRKRDDTDKYHCEYCPVKWPKDLNCNNGDDNLYIKFNSYRELSLYKKDREKYLAQTYLCAKFIAKLPVKH